jgi:hypothetical protein
MKMAFYKGKGDWKDRLIRLWSRCTYSHVELVISRNEDGRSLCLSSSPRDGGVRMKWIELDQANWDVVEIGRANQEPSVTVWGAMNMGAAYDWMALIGLVIRPIKGSQKKFMCSEAVAAALDLDEPWRLDIAMLHRMARTMNLEHWVTK